MAKRRRKSRRTRVPNVPSEAGVARQTTESRRVDLARDYAYVFADLGRIALIAGVMLVGLVALSFVLR